jgi:hypothetical protein
MRCSGGLLLMTAWTRLIMKNRVRPNYRAKIDLALEQGAGHDHALDLVGAFVDLGDLAAGLERPGETA